MKGETEGNIWRVVCAFELLTRAAVDLGMTYGKETFWLQAIEEAKRSLISIMEEKSIEYVPRHSLEAVHPAQTAGPPQRPAAWVSTRLDEVARYLIDPDGPLSS